MRVAHFNPYAVFAKSKKDVPTVKAYENMTAIDFTGKNETPTYQQNAIKTGPYANLENGAFFPPLLDDGGVKGVKNVLFGGESLFNTVVTGPGVVTVQSMPLSNLVGLIAARIPTSSSN